MISIQFGKATNLTASTIQDGVVPILKGKIDKLRSSKITRKKPITFRNTKERDNVGTPRPPEGWAMDFQFIKEVQRETQSFNVVTVAIEDDTLVTSFTDSREER